MISRLGPKSRYPRSTRAPGAGSALAPPVFDFTPLGAVRAALDDDRSGDLFDDLFYDFFFRLFRSCLVKSGVAVTVRVACGIVEEETGACEPLALGLSVRERLARCFELFGELGYLVLEFFLGAAKRFRIEKSEEFVELNELLIEIGCH